MQRDFILRARYNLCSINCNQHSMIFRGATAAIPRSDFTDGLDPSS